MRQAPAHAPRAGMPRHRPIVALIVLLAAIIAPVPARAQLGSIDGMPFAVGRGSFLATADGPAAGLTLPAAAAFIPDSRSLVAVELDGSRFAGGFILWQPKRFMLEYRHLEHAGDGPSFSEDMYAIGINAQKGRWVMASDVALLANSVPGDPNAFTFGFSAATRPHKYFSFAIRALHLNEPRYVGGKLGRIIAPGINIPVLGPRLNLAAEGYFREDGHDDFMLRYGIESECLPGVHVAASVSNERGFALSLALRHQKEQSGYGFSGKLDDDDRHHLIHVGREDTPRQTAQGKRVARPKRPAGS